MGGLQAVSDGRIDAAYLQPQPDDTIPRFEYERHLAALTGPNPHWPDSTRQVAQLRLSFRVRSGGVLGGLRGARVQHLDIIDYPGEWLLDLTLLDKSFTQWSTDLLTAMARRGYAQAFLAALAKTDPDAPHDETRAQELAASFTDYLGAARAAGLPDISPGRFLLPGDLAGSPALTFAPMAHKGQRGSLGREMERRFEAYKTRVVRPFFRDHFARIDRQIVLADVLGAVHAGPDAVAELGRTMTELLSAFRPGRNAWLTRLLGGKRVERILFAATKADHLHHGQHAKLTALMAALLRQARDRADFAGAQTEAMAIAAVRATVEDQRPHGSEMLDCVRGTLADTGKQAAFFRRRPARRPDGPDWARAGRGSEMAGCRFRGDAIRPGGPVPPPGRRAGAYKAGPRRAIPDRRHAMSRGPTLFELEDSATETPATAAQPPPKTGPQQAQRCVPPSAWDGGA